MCLETKPRPSATPQVSPFKGREGSDEVHRSLLVVSVSMWLCLQVSEESNSPKGVRRIKLPDVPDKEGTGWQRENQT